MISRSMLSNIQAFQHLLGWCLIFVVSIISLPVAHADKLIYLEIPAQISTGYSTSYWAELEDDISLKYVMNLEQREWQQSYAENISLGISKSPYWFHIPLINKASDLDWYLRINYPPTDDIQLYICPKEASNQNQCRYKRQGDRWNFDQRDRFSPNYIFDLGLDQAARFDLYLRIETLGSIQLPAELVEKSLLDDELSQNSFFRGAYVTMMLVMMLYNFFIFIMTRSVTYLSYSAFVLSFLFFHMTYNSTAFQYLWPDTPSVNGWALPAAFAINQFFTVLFTMNFLQLKRWGKYSYAYFRVLLVIMVIELLCVPFVSYNIMLPTENLMSILVSFSAFFLGVQYWLKGHTSARFFTIAWALFIAGLLSANLRTLGILPSNFFTLYGYQVGSFLEVVLLSLALGDRIQRLQREKSDAEQELLSTKEEAILNLQSYEELYQNSISGQFQLNEELEYIKTNPSFRRLISSDEEDFSLLPASFTTRVAKLNSLEQLMQRLSWQNQVKGFEISLLKSDGSQFIASLSIRKVVDQEQTLYNASIIDITDKIQRKALQKRAQAERLILLQQLVVGVSHEMNTPIGNVGMSDSFLKELIHEMETSVKERTLSPESLQTSIEQQREALSTLATSNQRLSELTKVFKSIAIHRSDYPLQSFDLIEFTKDWSASLSNRSTLSIQAPNTLEMTGFPTALLLVLQQLWQNTIEHNDASNKNLHIDIEIGSNDHSAYLIFSDNGIGLSHEECEKIFLPFYTKSRGIKKKMGLGMYQAYNLITDLSEGAIFAEANANGGLSIKIEMPLHISSESLC